MISGLIIDDNYIQLQEQRMNSELESKITDFDYDENIDNSLYSNTGTVDERLDQANEFMNELNLYIQLKLYYII